MATRIICTNDEYDLSNVNNLKDLREEIALLKTSLTKQEQQLESNLRTLPQHFLKSTADSLLPSFINKLIANGTWKLLLSSAAMFANPFSRGFSFKKNIIASSAKRLGLITLVKSAYNLWSSKRTVKHKPVEALNRPGITSLKTKNFRKS